MSNPCAPTPTTRALGGSGAPRRRSAARTTAIGSTQTSLSGERSASTFHAKRFGTTSLSASAPGRFMPTDCRSTQADERPRRH